MGGRVALQVALPTIFGAMTIGISLGMIAGFGPRWLDNLIILFFDTIRSFPTVMFALAVVALVGPSLKTVIFVIMMTSIPTYGRVVRTQTLTLRNSEFILAERSMGASVARILGVHILPNVMGPLAVLAAMDIPTVVGLEAGLSFLGMGVRPPTPSLGLDLERWLHTYSQHTVDHHCGRHSADPHHSRLHVPWGNLARRGRSQVTGAQMMSDNVLEITDLSIHYDTQRGPLQALRHVNLTVPRGKIVGVVGESGCGKSTLISAIIRLLAPNADIASGTIQFDGHDLLGLSDGAVRDLRGQDISMVFQDPMQTHNPVLTVGRQMTDIQYRDKTTKEQKRQRAIDMLALVGIPDPDQRLTQYPHEFSGGMRQRIAIAMALMARPKLLIADEPTTALDATLEVQIIKRLHELQAEIGCSILFISHHLGVIAELCDEVVVMYAGEVVEQGSVRQVFHAPRHPYTKALLECDPGHIKEATRNLPTIPGEIPDLVHIPPGCAFAERCPQVFAECRTRRPDWNSTREGHHSLCHLAQLKEAS